MTLAPPAVRWEDLPCAEWPAKPRVPHAVARALALELVALLRDRCERIVIAGSIRRRRETCGDVELLTLPIREPRLNLLGDVIAHRNLLDERVDELVDAGVLHKRVNKAGHTSYGEKTKFLVYRDFPLDLFSCTPPAEFGALLLIRTGPATFSQRFVTQRSHGGCLPAGFKYRGGALWHGERKIPTPDESDVFDAIAVPYLPRTERTDTTRLQLVWREWEWTDDGKAGDPGLALTRDQIDDLEAS